MKKEKNKRRKGGREENNFNNIKLCGHYFEVYYNEI